MRAPLAAAAVAMLAGCSDFGLDDRTFQCATHEDCAEGYRCGGDGAVEPSSGAGVVRECVKIAADDGNGDGPCEAAQADIPCLGMTDCAWRCVPATEGWVGCNPALDGACAVRPEEQPARRVTVAPFLVHRSEVTRESFATHWNDTTPSVGCDDGAARLAGAADAPLTCEPSLGVWTASADTAALPMTRVRWVDAMAFCAARGATLCSEAQWEVATRGGCEVVGSDCAGDMPTFPWGQATPSCARANGAGCGDGLQPVERVEAMAGASPYGLRDTAGNAAEWVFDCWHPTYEGAPDTDVPWLSGCSERVVRGGSYLDTADELRASARRAKSPTAGDDAIGFRCCRRLAP